MGDWQPIETAPKDGTVVDLWDERRYTDMRWHAPMNEYKPRGWCDSAGYIHPYLEPTHWMPPPGQPADKT